MSSSTPVLRWLSAGLLALTAAARTNTDGTGVVKIIVNEGDSVTLPCSMTNKMNLNNTVFDWKKDGLEVFLYVAGSHYGNGHVGQDEQYRGRVSHFEEEVKDGNASIFIRDTQIADSGNYTCVIPHLLGGRTFHSELVVGCTFKNRFGLTPGAAPQPYVKILNATEGRVLLECVVQGAHPRPELQWKAADGSVVPAEEPQVSERGGRYNVTLLAKVTKSEGNRFFCVVKQEDFSHVIDNDVPVPEKLFESCPGTSMFIVVGGLVSVALNVALALIVVILAIIINRKNGSGQRGNGSAPSVDLAPDGSGQQGNGSA